MKNVILTEYLADTRSYDRGAARYDRSLARQERLTNTRLNRIDKRWERSTRAITGMRTAVAGLTGVLSGAALAQLRQYGEAWRSVERRLLSIGESGTAAEEALVGLALRTRSSLEGTAAAVQRLSRSTGDDLETTVRRVETLQKLLAAGGATGAERSSVTLQLGQALQSGVLSGDEFRSIRETAPVEFLDALAQAAGVTRAELRATAEAQALTTDVVLEALDSLATSADANFDRLAVSGEEAFAILRTGLVAYVGQLDESLGATEAMNGAMAGLGRILSENAGGAETVARAFTLVTTAALGLAGARGLGALTRSFQSAAQARQQDVQAAQAQLTQSKLARAAADAEVRKRQTNLLLMRQEGASKAQLTREQKALNAAIRQQLAASTGILTATARQEAALRRLSLAARVTTGSMTALRGVMAFFGGPLGLALTGLSLAVGYFATMQSTGDRLSDTLQTLETDLSRLGDVNRSLAKDYDLLEKANQRVEAAIRAGEQASKEAADADVANIKRRIAANEEMSRNLIAQLQVQRQQAQQDLEKLITDSSLALQTGLRGPGSGLGMAFEVLLDRDGFEADMQAMRQEFLATAQTAAAAGEPLTDLQKEVIALAVQTDEAQLKMAALDDQIRILTDGTPALEGGLDSGTEAAENLGTAAATAAGQVDGLIRLIPRLRSSLRVEEDLAAARQARDQALAGAADLSEVEQINALYREAAREILGVVAAERERTEALQDAQDAARNYASEAAIGQLDRRQQALAREEARYRGIVAELKAAGAAQEDLTRAEEAYLLRRQQIEGGAFAGSDAGRLARQEARDKEREAAAAIAEYEARTLSDAEKITREKERLLALMPQLISSGLSEADAQDVVNAQLDDYKKRLDEVKTASERATESVVKGALEAYRRTGDVADAIGSISDRLYDLAADQIFDIIAERIAGAFAGLGGGGGGGLGGALASFGVSLFSARGNVFDRGDVTPFARGGVVTRPTGFMYGGGRLGVMGEAGPEAILPLERGPDGRLGVTAQVPVIPEGMTSSAGSAEGGMHVSVSFTGDIVIHTQSDEPDAMAGEMVRQFEGMFEQMFARSLQRASRGGGYLDQTYERKRGT
ncbi:tape measure protein [Pseudaestuariivita rosea]|uniref:tape measure protein n=1 Tax=Pseudaestuariivita rosea TaxID=2763263 RepID=UPI001ABB9C00